MQLLNENKIDVHQQIPLVHKCSSCDKIMDISEGDILYGTQWYHKSCWDVVEKEQSKQSILDANLISLTNYA